MNILEDYHNCYCKKIIKLRNKYFCAKNKLYKLYIRKKYNKLCFKAQTFLPLSAKLGNDIVFPHGFHGIFISSQAIIGNNCTIFQQVTVGSNTLKDSKKVGSPIIGNNCYIGAGAKIIGNVKVGNNVRIGANATVTFDIPDNCTVVPTESTIIQHNQLRDNEFIPIGKISKSRKEQDK